MTPDLPWRRTDILLATVAATAAAEVQDRVMDLATHQGRTGMMVSLRVQARDLALSGIGRDQVRSRAFEAAADDIAWGRPPLVGWRTFAIDAVTVPDEDRAALRERLSPAGPRRPAWVPRRGRANLPRPP